MITTAQVQGVPPNATTLSFDLTEVTVVCDKTQFEVALKLEEES